VAWSNLGADGGGTVNSKGKAYSQEECFEQALEVDPKYGKAWCNLGVVGGGMDGGGPSLLPEAVLRDGIAS